MLDPLNEFFYMTFQIFYVLGMVVAFMGVPILVLFWKKMMPKCARTLFWAARRNTPPLLLVHDSGRGEITTIHERKGEGVVMTQEGKYKILPRIVPKTRSQVNKVLAEQGEEQIETSEDAAEGEESKSIVTMEFLNENFVLDYSDWIVKRCSLVGLRMPFFIGYTGKLCLLNPEALALYEMGDMVVDVGDKVLFNPHNIADKKLDDALKPMKLLDGRKINEIIYHGFDQSQIAGVIADTEELVRLGKGISKTTIAIMTLIVIACVAAAALFFLPQIITPTPQIIRLFKFW